MDGSPLMEPKTFIDQFLHRVRQERSRTFLRQGVYLLLAVLSGGYLLANLWFYYFPHINNFGEVFLLLIVSAVGVLIYICFIKGAFAKFSPDQAALLTEAKYPQLQNSLINANQLKRHLDDPDNDKRTSLFFIRELLGQTVSLIRDIEPESVIDKSQTVRARRILLGTLGSLILVSLVLPDFLPRGHENWTRPSIRESLTASSVPGEKKWMPASLQNPYSIEELWLTFNYPAYTQLKSETLHPSDGEVRVLPGTEVRITAKTNLPVEGAELVLNNLDHFSMQKQEGNRIKGRFIVKEKGVYQFQIKEASGDKFLLATKYPIHLNKDNSPSIILLLANPKPVYFETDKVQFFYEGSDDFGISRIDLFAQVNGKTIRKEIKQPKSTEKVIKDGYTWNLNLMLLNPGDQVQYYLEIRDNDNLFGPNTGHSETFSFTVFDSRKERENLIFLQEELMEKMIALLGNNLVRNAVLLESPSDPMSWKQLFSSNTDALIDIINQAQRIKDRAESIDRFPQPYFNLLNNLISSLTRIREDQIDETTKIQNTVQKPTQAEYNIEQASLTSNKLILNLEQNILYLIKMTNRQKMDQVMDLEKRLSELTESLREEFEKIKDKKSVPRPLELKAKIEQMQQTLQKIMEQLASQSQSLPDEFLNSNAFKSMNLQNFNAALEKLKNLAAQGKFEEALEELKKLADDLKSLANQLDQQNHQLDELIDTELMEQLEETSKKLDRLEKDQKALVGDTTRLNQSMRTRQSKKFEAEIKNLFKELLKDVNQIQDIFQEDEKYLDNHPVMQTLKELTEKEIKLNERIQDMRQKTVEPSLSEGLEANFRALNKSRRELTRLLKEKDSLRVKEFQKYLESLPNVNEKYRNLEELAELRDLNEFNHLFKNTYPETFRLQNNLRTTPNRREDLADRVDSDLREVTRLNGEISKKLGSTMRELRDNYPSMLTQKDRSQLTEMARRQNQMEGESRDLSEQFSEMNQQNPTISPDLSKGMSRAGNLMKQAENDLNGQDVQGGVESENRALQQIRKTRDLLDEIKNTNNQMQRNAQRKTPLKLGTGSARDPRRGGSVRMQRERVLLPTEDQYKVPTEFREEILDAMKRQTPKNYERMVGEYYKELVK
ncbi:MAG: hypothetical protein VX667_04780 [Nitrospinota bacterium]|nr:hypothetical protein [Nitrospinota bacterium]